VLGISRFSIILIGSILIAVLGARPYASSWNDGSRLASVEALVDQHTWVIDNSIFVKVPEQFDLDPYGHDLPSTGGTMDKMFINGHFYSDKPPVATLYLAGIYWTAQKLTGLTAARDPHIFVYLLTLMSSSLAYVIGVCGIWFLALRLGLPEQSAFLVTVSFALATVAPIYSRQVNNSIIELAFFAVIFVLATAQQQRPGLFGFLVGVAYTLDLGVGPVLVLSALIYGCIKWRNLNSLALCVLGMVPFMALHHWFNYQIGGMIGPMNANVAYSDFPGSAFSANNMTGHWAHDSVWGLIQYALELLIGQHGFLLYNLPLLLIPVGVGSLWRAFPQWRAELLFAALIAAGSWMVYALGSNNYSGSSTSIRWLVPLLVPGYFALMLMLRARPGLLYQFRLLTEFGGVLTISLFWYGPFRIVNLLIFWPLVVLALVTLLWTLWRSPSAAALELPASA
jgi:hypothetical protein